MDTENEKGRKETVTSTGIRWSELYCLPYFDPSRMVVVDCMHNLFLGLVQEHFKMLGIRMDNNKRGKETPALCINISKEAMSGLDKNEHKSMDKLIKTLESPMNKELESQDGYDMYLKRLGKLHKQPLKLVFESFEL